MAGGWSVSTFSAPLPSFASSAVSENAQRGLSLVRIGYPRRGSLTSLRGGIVRQTSRSGERAGSVFPYPSLGFGQGAVFFLSRI